jgi:hypothetical protein
MTMCPSECTSDRCSWNPHSNWVALNPMWRPRTRRERALPALASAAARRACRIASPCDQGKGGIEPIRESDTDRSQSELRLVCGLTLVCTHACASACAINAPVRRSKLPFPCFLLHIQEAPSYEHLPRDSSEPDNRHVGDGYNAEQPPRNLVKDGADAEEQTAEQVSTDPLVAWQPLGIEKLESVSSILRRVRAGVIVNLWRTEAH